jgi:hypothetical protein
VPVLREKAEDEGAPPRIEDRGGRMSRHSDSPAVWFLLSLMASLAVGAACFVEGAKVKHCPGKLDDGRRLQRIDMKNQVCLYTPAAPTLQQIYPPVEVRRILAARKRMEAVR